MNERLELRGKLNKIKEIEVLKKLHYYLEKKIRLFIKDRQHEESIFKNYLDKYLQSFEAFRTAMHDDKKVMSFGIEVQKELFEKISAQEEVIPTKSKIPSPTSANH